MKLLIKAFTHSQSEDANLIVVNFDKSYVEFIKECWVDSREIRRKDEFKDVCFWAEDFSVYFDEDNKYLPESKYTYDDERFTYFKVVSPMIIDDQIRIMQELDSYQFSISHRGLSFKCYGEDTHEEFWSATIDYENFHKLFLL